ncbi:M28 family peptidase [Thermogladius sp. 4427co]|uniref:M28 family peptidase n=1 Tax=Thermogladius sp. 4427co TaxID=3450718 RepID=UPI003F79F9D2
MKLREEAGRILKEIPVSLGRDLLYILTRYHRVTGSRGLIEAVRELKEVLENSGIPARIHYIDNNITKGFIETPVGWIPRKAELEIKIAGKTIARLDLDSHPTLLSAHSPGGEGCGRVRVCESECSGEVVLTNLNPYDAYNIIDAKLILHYDKNRYHDAVPYTGLFITEKEVKHGKVVMNIPFKIAMEIMSRLLQKPDIEVEACWKSDVSFENLGLPVLVSCEESPRVLIVSHICHPKPGAHDNASGSVSNFLSAFAIRNMKKTGELGVCHVWVPEYTGTVFVKGLLKDLPEYVINLDMVGSKQNVTGSVLSIVNPPLMFEAAASAALYVSARAVFDNLEGFEGIPQPSIRYDISPYSAGSDHDVFLVWGIDSGMLNEWPSKYYHTDYDTPDTISPNQLVNTAAVATLASKILSDEYLRAKTTSLYRNYLRDWYMVKSITLGLESEAVLETRYKPSGEIMASPFSSRFIYKNIGREAFYKMRGIKGAFSYLTVYAPIAEANGVRDHLQRFISEELLTWDKETVKTVSELWEKLRGFLR